MRRPCGCLGKGQSAPSRSSDVVGERGVARRSGGAIIRLGRSCHPAARRGGDRSQHFRLPLVLAVDPALPPTACPCARRFAVCAALRAGDADLFPACGRQGARPQRHVDAGGARRRHGDLGPVRVRAAIPPILHPEPHHQPHRRGTGPAALPSSVSSAARLFRDSRGGADGRAHARTGDDPQLPDRTGTDRPARPRLHPRLHRGDVDLFGQAHPCGADLDPGLCRHRRPAAADLARADQREVQPGRPLAAVSGRVRSSARRR